MTTGKEMCYFRISRESLLRMSCLSRDAKEVREPASQISGGRRLYQARTASAKGLGQAALASFQEQNKGRFGWVRRKEEKLIWRGSQRGCWGSDQIESQKYLF